jgi:hypothetical protein
VDNPLVKASIFLKGKLFIVYWVLRRFSTSILTGMLVSATAPRFEYRQPKRRLSDQATETCFWKRLIMHTSEAVFSLRLSFPINQEPGQFKGNLQKIVNFIL